MRRILADSPHPPFQVLRAPQTYLDPDRIALVMIQAAARVLEAEGALHHVSARWVSTHVRIRRER